MDNPAAAEIASINAGMRTHRPDPVPRQPAEIGVPVGSMPEQGAGPRVPPALVQPHAYKIWPRPRR